MSVAKPYFGPEPPVVASQPERGRVLRTMDRLSPARLMRRRHHSPGPAEATDTWYGRVIRAPVGDGRCNLTAVVLRRCGAGSDEDVKALAGRLHDWVQKQGTRIGPDDNPLFRVKYVETEGAGVVPYVETSLPETDPLVDVLGQWIHDDRPWRPLLGDADGHHHRRPHHHHRDHCVGNIRLPSRADWDAYMLAL
jgi:hypothetical protein